MFAVLLGCQPSPKVKLQGAGAAGATQPGGSAGTTSGQGGQNSGSGGSAGSLTVGGGAGSGGNEMSGDGGKTGSGGALSGGGMGGGGGASGTNANTGGSQGNGGFFAAGGRPASGGATSAGGNHATGGATSTGGTLSSGGNHAIGGATSAGGATGGTHATGGATSSGGAVSSGSTNSPITGSNGFATRYWDCCKPSCAWSGNSNPPVPSCAKDGTTKVGASTASGCDSGSTSGAFECYDFSPWFDSSTNTSYGFAAFNASGCGVCYELQFTGKGNSNPNDPGSQQLAGQQMIVQVINIGNITSGQFDLLIPGGGVGAETKGCPAQWGSSTDLGATNGGLLTECKDSASCLQGKCQSTFGSFPSLLAGCNWFAGWFGAADNPQLVYKQVTCPSQLTSKSGISK